jgi:chromosome segregation ATPase
MSRVADKEIMRRKLDCMLVSADQFEVTLRKTEQSLLSKIEAQQQLREKLNSRREFYEKMQTNIGRGQEQAFSKLDAAEKAMAVVQRKVEALELEYHSSKAALGEVMAQNKLNVLPKLERLGNLLKATKDESATLTRAYTDDEQRLQELSHLKHTLDTEDRELTHSVKEKEDILSPLRANPDMHAEKLARARQDATSIQLEIDGINHCKMIIQTDVARQESRISELHEQKNAETNKLHNERHCREERRLRVDGLQKKLAQERIVQHDFAAVRLETELRIKNSQDEVKHNSNFLIAENRQLTLAKSALVKKQQALSILQTSVPLATAKLQELQQSISIMEVEKQANEQTLSLMKARVDSCIMNLAEEEYIEKDILDRLHASSKAVAERECEIEHARIEENKAGTFATAASDKCAITRRKVEQSGHLKIDVDMEIHVQEIRRLDLTKKINDAEKKARDFAALLDMIRSEKDETSRLTIETQKSLSEVKKRSNTLQAELLELKADRAQKKKTLEEEIDARVASQQTR